HLANRPADESAGGRAARLGRTAVRGWEEVSPLKRRLAPVKPPSAWAVLGFLSMLTWLAPVAFAILISGRAGGVPFGEQLQKGGPLVLSCFCAVWCAPLSILADLRTRD